MKGRHASTSMSVLCGLLGLSRQAYYQQLSGVSRELLEQEIILKEVHAVRKFQPKVGVRKLFLHLEAPLQRHGIQIGRDALFKLLRDNYLLVRRRKRRKNTTDSNHSFKKHPNLIKDFIPMKANELWVSDITYVDTVEGFVYLFLITDAYSHKIVGYTVSDTLEARGAVLALRMALASRKTDHQLIHHSDRGVQYCCHAYIGCLKEEHRAISVSMTENGDPYENALAERVNGILKTELLPEFLHSKTEAKTVIDRAIQTYNTLRLHSSVDMLTPLEAHEKTGELKKHWKPKKTTPFSPSEAKVKCAEVSLQEQALMGF